MTTWAPRRRTVLAGTAVAIVAVIAGFSMAALSLFVASQNQTGGGQALSAGPVSGLSYSATILNVTPAGGILSWSPGLGSPGSPVPLVAGSNGFCLSGAGALSHACTPGDLGEWTEYTFSVALTGALEIHVALRANGTVASQSVFVAQSAPQPSSGTIDLVWDLGQGNVTLEGMSVVVNQCASPAACP